jgi:hypothetical protein
MTVTQGLAIPGVGACLLYTAIHRFNNVNCSVAVCCARCAHDVVTMEVPYRANPNVETRIKLAADEKKDQTRALAPGSSQAPTGRQRCCMVGRPARQCDVRRRRFDHASQGDVRRPLRGSSALSQFTNGFDLQTLSNSRRVTSRRARDYAQPQSRSRICSSPGHRRSLVPPAVAQPLPGLVVIVESQVLSVTSRHLTSLSKGPSSR